MLRHRLVHAAVTAVLHERRRLHRLAVGSDLQLDVFDVWLLDRCGLRWIERLWVKVLDRHGWLGFLWLPR
jgi:hypothetical protein